MKRGKVNNGNEKRNKLKLTPYMGKVKEFFAG